MSDSEGLSELTTALCAAFGAYEVAAGQFVLQTPFQFPDGDGYALILERSDKGWRLTDNGDTASHLAVDDVDFTPARLDLLVDIAEGSGFSYDDLVLSRVQAEAPTEFDIADLVQAIAQLQAIRFVSREQVRRLYRDDLAQFVENRVPRENRTLKWSPPQDSKGLYAADAYLTPTDTGAIPTTLFAVGNAEQAERATIAILMHKRWQVTVEPLVVYDRRVSNRIGSPRIFHLQDAAGDHAVIPAAPTDWTPVERALAERHVPMGTA